ncbi:MAG: hypothetical protein NTX53_17310 [candidate division WOR-3 bacterium]|nr:hypothetical protein [candidate division WOR-3 bacterium]
MTTRTRLLLLAVAAIYYAACVWRPSFVIDGTRYFMPADDVMITMCYGRTLADVGQLAWYPGGPGGGFSSILWVWLSALAWKLWPVVSRAPLLIQAFNGVAYVLTVFYAMRAADLLGGNRAATIAGVLTIACWPVVNVFAQGWEFSMVALGLVTAYYYWLRRKWWLVAAAAALIVLTRFPLPTNTLALKLSGYPWLLMVTRGAWVEFTDLLRRGLPLLFLTLVAARTWSRERRPLLWTFLAAVLLSVAVGGDAWQSSMEGSRIVISALPLLAILGSLAVVDVTRNFSKLLRAMVVALLCLTWVNPAKTLLIHKPGEIQYQRMAWMARWVSNHTERDTKIAVAAAGIIPWMAQQRLYVDLLGMNEATIARMPAHRAPKGKNPLTWFLPGHLKFSMAWTIEHHAPDMILQVWATEDFPEELEATARDYHVISLTNDTRNNVLVRNDTKKVRQ